MLKSESKIFSQSKDIEMIFVNDIFLGAKTTD